MTPRVALVHDWITGNRGGERCLAHFLNLYPSADIFTLIHKPGTTIARIDARVKKTSVLSRLPRIERYYRYLLPFFPIAISTLNIPPEYDLVISLSHAAAKNIKAPPGAVHVCYCFSPMRYIWDQSEAYFGRAKIFLSPILEYLRRWDRRGARGVDHFISISSFISERIRKYYDGREATIIHPPVDTSWIGEGAQTFQQGEAFLYAGALVPYKLPDVIVEAFNRNGLPLWIAGSGPMEEGLKSSASSNIKFLGRVSDQEFGEIFKRCRALIFPGVEDFGMIPVECLAAGRPVIGVHAGGLIDTIRGDISLVVQSETKDLRPQSSESPLNGVFFSHHSGKEAQIDALNGALYYFIEREEGFLPQDCIAQSRLFSPQVFDERWGTFLREKGLGQFLPD